MRTSKIVIASILAFSTWGPSASAIDYFVSPTGGNVAPFASWANAATNIQDAIDAASAGDVVWVTNGVYASGGRVMGGDLTNRIALNKALTVQSVNGPSVTIIQGLGATNGPSAVRCVWLTNNAVLTGFTVQGGATRAISGSVNQQMNGGGIWGSSLSAIVINCVVSNNAAANLGGGAYRVSLLNCILSGNHAVGSGTPGFGVGGAGAGGGAASCNLTNCVLTGNTADQDRGGATISCNLRACSITRNSSFLDGGGAYSGTLVNCTITLNTSGGYGTYGAAVAGATLTNCIVYANLLRPPAATSISNYNNCTLAYCCTAPLASGVSNINLNPQLLADGVHLVSTSPCRGAGTNIVGGTDIDGQPWGNPPPIGCDEWQPAPVIGGQYQVALGGIPLSATISGLIIAGQDPFTYWWLKDGAILDDGALFSSTHTTSLSVNRFGPEAAGNYALIASNAFGMATSSVAQVVVHCADAGGANPVAPYATWATAATSIQDAIDVASAGEYVIVTNGFYVTGGRVMASDLTNRAALAYPLTAASVNGPNVTVIQGAWDPGTTNGPLAVRCAWVGDGANLIGFTLRNGATRSTGDVTTLQRGGGAWCVSTNAVVSNCVFTNNAAPYGGGISSGTLNNSFLSGNYGFQDAGGAYYSTLNNCTVVGNTVYISSGVAGTDYGITRNSIVLNNYYVQFGLPYSEYNYSLSSANRAYSYCLTRPSLSGTGNTNGDPQFLDYSCHISTTSPCHATGSALYASGTDLDGEVWANPPSIGCDEVVPANLVGPLSVALKTFQTNLFVGRAWFVWGLISGRPARLDWSFGDGPVVTNLGFGTSHIWKSAGDFQVVFTAYNLDNPVGVSTNLLIHVLPLQPPLLQPGILSSDGFQFQFAAQLDASYQVQATTSLTPPVAWQTIQLISASVEGVQQVVDPAATNNAARFYRVLVR